MSSVVCVSCSLEKPNIQAEQIKAMTVPDIGEDILS